MCQPHHQLINSSITLCHYKYFSYWLLLVYLLLLLFGMQRVLFLLCTRYRVFVQQCCQHSTQGRRFSSPRGALDQHHLWGPSPPTTTTTYPRPPTAHPTTTTPTTTTPNTTTPTTTCSVFTTRSPRCSCNGCNGSLLTCIKALFKCFCEAYREHLPQGWGGV